MQTTDREIKELVKTPELTPLETMRHSCAHVMAHAITRMYPGAQFGVGPHIENGFYYDVLFPKAVTEEVLPQIEAEMKKIIKEGRPFQRKSLSRAEAENFFGDKKQNFKFYRIGTNEN